tara:strand:- start:659 stop:829 length:171 start_codon:yes stop_codon:yes gene_type:complete
VYKILINSGTPNDWIEKKFEYVVEALQCVRIHHHTRLIYPCGSVAEYIQGTMIDLR